MDRLNETMLAGRTIEGCPCSKQQELIGDNSLEVFTTVRPHCPALHRLFVPDEIWLTFQQWNRQPDSIAHHRSILLLAMERGHLGRVTSAAHRFLMDGQLLRSDARQQYVQDLRERWMFYKNPIERHQKFRIFAGRLAELQFAEWLELNGWTVSSLEAHREGPDIEACVNDGLATAFEVKFLGTEDDDFRLILENLAGQPAVGRISPYSAINYLLFRTYEAAKQLQRVACNRIAIIIVDGPTWFRFKLQLSDGWIDWANPKFFDDHSWGKFLASQQTRYPALPYDLRPAIQSLNAIWILRQSEGYQYHHELEIPLDRI